MRKTDMPLNGTDVSLVELLPEGPFHGVVVPVRVARDSTSIVVKVPALLTNRGLVIPLLDYCCREHAKRSLDWLRKLCRACLLFLEYAAANRGLTDKMLFEQFAHRLVTGTFGVGAHVDPSWLCWRPVSLEDAQRTVSLLKAFFVGTKNGADVFLSEPTSYDVFMRRASYAHAREKSFFGYTWAVNPSNESLQGSVSPLPRALNIQSGEPTAFPEERLMDLLFKGWCVHGRLSLRDMAITLLLNGGGVRTSEPFHMYVTDVHEDPLKPGSAMVLIHHPTEGAAPEFWSDVFGKLQTGNRRTYLNEHCNMEPRTLQSGTSHSGFKGAAMTEAHGSKYFQVQWFPPQLGVVFMNVWKRYLIDVVSIPRNHPFGFVNISRGEKGDIYKLPTFRQAHGEAVRRIGLVPSRVEGTAPHGHRHAYGGRLSRAGVKGELIMRYMHHLKYESHLVYTRATQAEMVHALQEANIRLAGSPDSLKWDSFVDEVDFRLKRT